jgi:hypothetical protein
LHRLHLQIAVRGDEAEPSGLEQKVEVGAPRTHIEGAALAEGAFCHGESTGSRERELATEPRAIAFAQGDARHGRRAVAVPGGKASR